MLTETAKAAVPIASRAQTDLCVLLSGWSSSERRCGEPALLATVAALLLLGDACKALLRALQSRGDLKRLTKVVQSCVLFAEGFMRLAAPERRPSHPCR